MKMFDLWEECCRLGPDLGHRLRLRLFWIIVITIWYWET